MAWPQGTQQFGVNHAPLLSGLDSLTGTIEVPIAVNKTNGAILLDSVSNALVASPLVGQSKIATTGTAIQLNGGTSQPLTNGIIISAPSTNSTFISIGPSSVNNTAGGTGNGYLLSSGASVSFAVTNTNDIWINGTSGDFVSWAGS